MTNLHLWLQFPDNVSIRVRPGTLERVEDDIRVCRRLFQQPTCNSVRYVVF